ncbi:DUF4062 domain-containing protein [Amycolatopsis sp. NPDC052450]|uniref:DUF4062 domain-containing protein n=1 Tax=Amycolatopsis sp. NPDC052450 TaxID=3363937 RepID=UPI0037C9AE10
MPVFVASTFRDMDYERDVLARVVIPTVNERLRERRVGVSLYPVDLRWGIETDDNHDLETRQRFILETCVREVRRCWPLFVGLVGGKFGWIPPKELREAALETAGLVDPGFPLSVTALEMVVAAQAADGVAPILLSRQVPDGGPSPIPDADPPEHEGPGLLRAYLAGLGYDYRFYAAEWRSSDQRYESAEFAAVATEALLDTVNRLVTTQDATGWLTAELGVQQWTAEREARQFIGRADELRFVGGFWGMSLRPDEQDIGDDPNSPLWRMRHQVGASTIAVVGASGSGKSALLAKVATDLPIDGWLAERFEPARAYVQVGATSASERLPVCLLLLLAQLDPAAAQSLAEHHNPDSVELDDVLDTWLTVLERGTRLFGPLIVVDGLDRLRGQLIESQPMAWLPISLRDRVRVVVSVADDSFEATLLTCRPSTHVLPLGDLDRADALELVCSRVAAHHRAVPTTVVDVLVRQATSPRWLVVATDLLLTLMAHDYLVLRRLSAADVDPEVAIRRLLESVATELPASLEGIHEEAFHRLLDLVDDRLGWVLGILSVSVFGLGEQNLEALLSSIGPGASAVDFALFRDVLSVHVNVIRDEWRFAHRSAAEGADRMLDAASEAVGQDVSVGYRRGLVSHLVGLPLDDPVRSRELLVQLLFLEEDTALARCLADDQLASDQAVQIFGMVLGTIIRTDLRAGRLVRLIAAAAEGCERLTTVQVISAHVLPVLGRHESVELAAHCREALAQTPPQTRSRFGLEPADLEHLLAAVVVDSLASREPAAVDTWFEAARDGAAGLRDLPDRTAQQTDMHTWLAVGAELRAITEYTFAVNGGLITSYPGDPSVARRRLDEARALAECIDDRYAGMRHYLRHLVAIATRASAATWPSAGFQPEDGDFGKVRALTDRTRGNADFVHLLAMCARVHALEQLATLSDDTEVTPADAVAIHTALEFLEEAIWQVNVQLAITPDSVAARTIAIQCDALRTALLHACDQHASAARAGIRTCLAPRAVDVLGRENFIKLAGDILFDWIKSTVDVSPVPLIDRMILETSESTTEPPVEVIEGMLLITALTAARRLGEMDGAIRVVERSLALVRSGVLDPSKLPVDEIVDEAVAEIEDDLLEAAEEGEGLDDEDRALLAQAASGAYWLRSALMRHRPARPADLAGATFAASLSASLGHPDQRVNAQRLRCLLASSDKDPRRRRLTALADKLLEG